MTYYVNDYPFGHAGCCSCKRDLDLSADPYCLAGQKGNLVLFFYYCSECFSSLQAAGREACGKAIGKVLEKGLAGCGNGLAMTTSLALQAHGGDLVKAFEIGVRVPRMLHEAILAGQTEAAIVPPLGWEA
jgi:hypothetical protein